MAIRLAAEEPALWPPRAVVEWKGKRPRMRTESWLGESSA